MRPTQTHTFLLNIAASLLLMTGCAVVNDPARYLGNSQPTTITPNAYGLGVNSDQYGRPQTYRTQDGQQLSPIFQGGVKPNAYGPGVGMDQFGRPVYSSPP